MTLQFSRVMRQFFRLALQFFCLTLQSFRLRLHFLFRALSKQSHLIHEGLHLIGWFLRA